MKGPLPTDPFVEAKLLGILLAGVLSQTRPECLAHARAPRELRPSGAYRITAGSNPSLRLPKPPKA